MIARWLAMPVIVVLTAAAAEAATLVLHPMVSVDRAGTVLLHQMGRVLIGRGEKPLPEVRIKLNGNRRLTREHVVASIRDQLPRASVLQIVGPDHIRIESPVPGGGSNIEELAQAALLENLQGKLSNISLVRIGVMPNSRSDIDSVSKDTVRICSIEYWKSRQCVWVDQYQNGKLVSTSPVWFSVSADVDVWQLGADVSAKTVAKMVALHAAQVPIAELRQAPVTVLSEVAGYRFTGDAKAGEVLTKDMLGPIPDILFGELVQVESVIGDVRILTKAVSQSEGKVGEEIQLLSLSSEERFAAIVVDKGQVRVSGENNQDE